MREGEVIAWVSSKFMVSGMSYKLDKGLRWWLGVYGYWRLFLLKALGLHPPCKVCCRDIDGAYTSISSVFACKEGG